MTSKEAFEKIEYDLEILELLRKSIYNKTESKHSLFTDFVVIDLFIKGEDAVKVKEWLENDNERENNAD